MLRSRKDGDECDDINLIVMIINSKCNIVKIMFYASLGRLRACFLIADV